MTAAAALQLALFTVLGSAAGLGIGYAALRLGVPLATPRKLGRDRATPPDAAPSPASPGAPAAPATAAGAALASTARRPQLVPLLGGFLLAGGVFGGLFGAPPIREGDLLLSAADITQQLTGLGIAVAILFLAGFLSDVLDSLAARRAIQRALDAAGPLPHPLPRRIPSPPAAIVISLLGQVLAIAALLVSGVSFQAIVLPFGWQPGVPAAKLLTALWLFLFMQFSRFLDGIDGLIPAVAIVLTLLQLRVVWGGPEPFALELGVISLALFLLLLPLHLYPARVYLGHAGAALPGLLLGMLAIAARTKTFLTAGAILPMAMALLALGYLALRLLERTSLAVSPAREKR